MAAFCLLPAFGASAQTAAAVVVFVLLLVALASSAAAAEAVPDTLGQRALACTGCHRPQGRATPRGYLPRMAGEPAGYLAAQLRAFGDGQRPQDAMARLRAPLGDEYLAELATTSPPFRCPTLHPRPPGVRMPHARWASGRFSKAMLPGVFPIALAAMARP
jgi:cytochrome c553